ncbi:ROK family transcriptional regulator [Demequina muriae]|uniref:ROK family transcriptional regulator n=1 Tax=Demequina muriae TaxID=3051664 RepID=A0ABT8GG03_9MICO|nr:ROK family transcriptional regulator [Demequina sp. EGI L300058]MDN4480355.1 ROK family transcriptional regulator [Demequina sp. EGI L300058]
MTSTQGSTGSQSSLREANSVRILDAVRQFGSITQVELSHATGLSPATVSTIVKHLLASGTVETRHTIRSGRRAQLVTLAHRAGLLIGLHVGERSLRVAISDSAFEFLDQREMPLPVDHRHDTTLDRAAMLISELVDGLGSALSETLALAIAVPAPVNPATGAVAIPGILPGWEGVPIGEVLGRRLGRPVAVDNDANLGALGEMRFGAGRGTGSLLYVRASYGVGSGIVLSGELYHGVLGIAGEIGHTLVDPHGHICRCGSRGCLNTVCGAQALVDSLRHSRGTVTLTDVLDLAEAGDPGCQQVVIDAGGAIGAVVANTAVSLSPEVIIVGGELSRAGSLFLEPIRESVRRRIPLAQSQKLEVRAAELGQRAELYGALALAADLAHIESVAS